MGAPKVHNYSTYSNDNCRCVTCRAAVAAYRRERTKLARERQLLVEAEGGTYVVAGIKHGASGYTNHRCCCEVCRTAHSEAARAAYRRAARRRGEVS